MSKLIITKKFNRININEIAEINVNAYDEKDNVFSSLEGFRFHWKISDSNLVEIMKLSQEKREVGERRLEVESKYHSDIILLKGITTGKVQITTEILEEEYREKNIKSESKSLYIVEPFSIYPSEPIFILPSNNLQFNIELLASENTKLNYKNQHRFVLPVNRKFYDWRIEDTSCGKIQNFGEFESGSEICTTKVIAEDNRLDYFNSTWNSVNVVHPTALDIQLMEITNEEAIQIFLREKSDDYLKTNFNLFEIQNSHRYESSNIWKLVENRKYLIKNVLMYDLHQIRYSNNGINFRLIADELKTFIDDIVCFHGREVCLLTTKKVTEKFLEFGSSIDGGFGIDKTYHIKKNVQVYPQLKIEKFGMKEFTLPFLGYYEAQEIASYKINDTTIIPIDQIKSQELRLMVTGGTGKYLFNSENSHVIQISEESLFGKNIGRVKVRVSDAEIVSNFDVIDVEVREVKDFSFLEGRQEIELGSEFFVNTIGLRSVNSQNEISNVNFLRENTFANCTGLLLNTSLNSKDKNIRQINAAPSSDKSRVSNRVSEFLQENTALKQEFQKLLKLDRKNQNNEMLRYLEYINYGICDSRGFVAQNEGMIKMSMNTQILPKKASQTINKIVSSKITKIYVYSPITLISPKFEDIFTKELVAKGNVLDPQKLKNFIMTVGSGIFIQFTGGIIPWLDYKNDYTENIHIIDAKMNRTASQEILKDKIKISPSNNKKTYIECLKENTEIEFMITVTNKVDKTLLRPGRSRLSFSIGCYYPKYLSIFLLSVDSHNSQNILKNQNSHFMHENQLNDVFSVPQKGGLEYFEKKNNLEVVRVYAFDDNRRIFVNITSIQGEWTQRELTGTGEFYKLMSEKEYNKYIRQATGDNKYISDKSYSSYPEYFHSFVLFGNRVGKFDLIYTSKNKESNYATINLIDFPTLTPNNSTLYFSGDNSLDISVQFGSGDFEITLNDNSLASFTFSDRKIKVVPLKQGVLYVYLKDNKINNNFMSVATVYISAIKSIHLIGGGLLMTNNTMDIGLKVYDNYNNVFDSSQVSKMNLIIGDYSHVSKGLEIKFSELSSGKSLHIRGLLADVYSLYLVDIKTGILSNSLRVEVFDRLQVFPPYLLMVPGTSYTLSVKGGPINEEHIVKRFEMLNSQVATVSSSFPEVKASLVGKTVLKIIMEFKPDYYKIYRPKDFSEDNEQSRILSVEEINVTVDFPDSVGIIGALNRKIYTKSTIRLLAALKIKDEIFTYGVGPLYFDWSLDNSLLAKLKFYKSEKDECKLENSNEKNSCNSNPHHIATNRNVNPQNSLGVFLSTSSQGSIEIKLTVKINYPEPYTGRKPNTFVSYEKVLIQDEIYVDIPEFYENIPNKSGLYLIPMDVDHDLHTNKNSNVVRFSLLSPSGSENNSYKDKEQVISLHDSGRITTYNQRGLAHVLINQREKDNMPFIPVVLPVYVTDFHSLFVEKSYRLIDMEIGQIVNLKIIIQHEYGILFADGKFERLKLKAVESHPKVATGELTNSNSLISIRGHSKGETNIILFDPSSLKIFDVFQISVYSSLIMPEKIFLNVGGTINFLKKDEKRKVYLSQDSEWISDNPQILKIDPVEGVAVALAEGVTKIHLVSKDKTKIKLSTKVEIARVKKINIDRTKIPKYFTDIKESSYYRSEYHIPVNVYIDESSIDELSLDMNDSLNEINQNLNLKCISNQPEIFLAETDKKTLNSQTKECIIKLRDIPFDFEAPSNLELRVSVEAQGERKHDAYTYRTTVLLPFMSAFKIKNKIKSISFANHNRTAFIFINNLNDLVIETNDPSVLKLELNREDEEGFVKLYVPHNVTESFHDVRLIIKNKQTEQKEEISLNYIVAKEEPSRIFYGLIRRDTLIDFITLIVLIIIIVILYNYLTSSDQVWFILIKFIGERQNCA